MEKNAAAMDPKNNPDKQDRIYIEFRSLFEDVKSRSELKSRSMADEGAERYIITDHEKDVLTTFYQDAVSDIAEHLGVLDRMKDYGGTTIYTLTALETSHEGTQTRPLVLKCFRHYLLYRWYRSVGRENLAAEFYQLYRQALRQQRTNSTQTNFVKPTYKPWW